MKFRGFAIDETRRVVRLHGERVGSRCWETRFRSRRFRDERTPAAMLACGGKTDFLGRSSSRFGDIDFRSVAGPSPRARDRLAARLQGDRPDDSRVERMIGVASTVQNRPSNPDGDHPPPSIPLPRSHPATGRGSSIGGRTCRTSHRAIGTKPRGKSPATSRRLHHGRRDGSPPHAGGASCRSRGQWNLVAAPTRRREDILST